MAKNAFLEKQKLEKKACAREGAEMGRQQIIDMLSLVLRNPKIMGKDVFGVERLLKIVDGIQAELEYYSPAWQKHDEADWYQKQLDTNLAEAYGPGLHDSFMERYPYTLVFDYNAGKWIRGGKK